MRTTFFLQGRWVEAYPRAAARIAPEGHLVGSHSHYHARMPLFTRGGLARDVRAAEAAIRRFAGVDPRPWFRCPFGSGTDNPLILRRLAELGYRETGWDVDSHDWARRTAAPVVSAVVAATLEHGDGAVVLFHGWPQSTIRALPAVLRQLGDAGAEFVRLDELPEREARAR